VHGPRSKPNFETQKYDLNSSNNECLNKGLITLPTTLQVQDLQAFANNYNKLQQRPNYIDQFTSFEKDNQPFIHRYPPFEKIIRNDNLIQAPLTTPPGVYPVIQPGFQSNAIPANNVTNYHTSIPNPQSLNRYSQNKINNSNQNHLVIDFNNLIDNNSNVRKSNPSNYSSSGMPRTLMRPINVL